MPKDCMPKDCMPKGSMPKGDYAKKQYAKRGYAKWQYAKRGLCQKAVCQMTACQKTLCQKAVCQMTVWHFTAQPGKVCQCTKIWTTSVCLNLWIFAKNYRCFWKKHSLNIKLGNAFYLNASRNLITGLAEASNVRIIKISPRSDQAPTNTLMQHRPLPSTQYAN